MVEVGSTRLTAEVRERARESVMTLGGPGNFIVQRIFLEIQAFVLISFHWKLHSCADFALASRDTTRVPV